MKRKLISFSSFIFIILLICIYFFALIGNQNSMKGIKARAANSENIFHVNSLHSNTAAKLNLNPMKFNVRSSAFKSGDTIPTVYVCTKVPGGKNVSIPIEWSSSPSETKSYSIFMYDLNPVAKNFVHWAVINIPNNAKSLNEGASLTSYMPSGSTELKNSSNSVGYTGPCPPKGTGVHEYKIIVYALNTDDLRLPSFASFNVFQSAIKGKVLAQAEISGYFEQ